MSLHLPPEDNINRLTDRLLSSWIRCKRKAWLDVYEKKERKIWLAYRTLQLDHQYKSIQAFSGQKAGHGIKACYRGDLNVIGLRLKSIDPVYNQIQAHPPLIHRGLGNSCFGDFVYKPVIARQGRKTTRNHRLSIALWGNLLGQLQQAIVREGIVISLSPKGLEVEKVFITNKLQNQLFDSIQKLKECLKEDEPPPITEDRKKCVVCPWKNYCNLQSFKEGDLNEINGIGAKRKEVLKSAGIRNLNELAKIKPKQLANRLQLFGEESNLDAEKLINQAKVQASLSPMRLNKTPVLPELNNAPGILIYDIESDPDIQHDFLHGFLCIKKRKDNKWDLDSMQYYFILSEENEDKGITWKKLKRNLDAFKGWPVIHYGETELISIIQIAKANKIPPEELQEIENQFIDIHKRIRENWILPIKSYGLKAVAKWLGFSWSQRNADGAYALLWWRQWININISETARNRALNKILAYNNDDCLATWKITCWLFSN